MSTVAVKRYDYGAFWRICLAADKRMSWHSTTVTKLWALDAGAPFVAIGGAGTYTSVLQAVDWVNAGMPDDAKPELDDKDFHLLAVDTDGNIFVAADSMQFMLLETDVHAIGSGGDYALGAMKTMTPAQAILVAGEYDKSTGNGLTEFHFDIPKENT